MHPKTIIEQKWPDNTLPLVSISCNTYMHKPFIRDAIEGFLIQKTTFPVEILINDDASTDGTADIMREYEKRQPNLIKATYQVENQYRKNPKTDKYVKHHPRKGKYVAPCEGDDYWTDPLKLQKQVEFMESNPDFSMCFHSVELVDGHIKTGKIAGAGDIDKVFSKNQLFYSGGYHSPTASLLYRREYTENPPQWRTIAPVGDVPLKLLLSLKGKIYYISQTMGVRRINVPGSWNDRVRKNPVKEYEYHLGMIKMLDGFNEFSQYKYNDEVLAKQLSYTIKTLPFLKTGERLKILRSKKYSPIIDGYKFHKKVLFYLNIIFPRLFGNNSFLRKSMVRLKEVFKQ